MSTPIRNIAIIAHVDHGKTTLVDKMLHQARLFRDNQEVGELILDNNDLERERGITILAKNVSVQWKDTKINIIDTPGHSDFGGEVERVLNMADGVLLLVDAFEGPMPQTRFVLQKALALGKKAIVVINKVDKPNCDPDKTHDDIFDLFFNLDANEEQLDFTTVFGSGKQGWFGPDYKNPTEDLTFLMDAILDIIPAPIVREGTPQLQITSLDYSNYTGRIAIGRLHRGGLSVNMPVSLVKRDGKIEKTRIKELFIFDGLGKRKVESVGCGDICAITGIDNFEIGDTLADFENPEAMPVMKIDEPTMSMLFTINNSPFFGKEGKFVTSQKIRERLMKEMRPDAVFVAVPHGDAAKLQTQVERTDPLVAPLNKGQRVGTLVMYLNEPQGGGATIFPEAGLEVAPVKGQAVFFSYDRAHPSTGTLHGGAPVLAGEKWVATKWLREGRFN